jgi:hypothetical protein
VYQAQANAVFADLAQRPKDWKLLALAAVGYFAALLITIVRWWYLVRALEIDFPFRDALRLGFLGFLFNLAPMGIVGGDLLKAILLGRHQPGHRAESLVTVLVDRVIGLYVLFLVASAAVVATGMWRVEVPTVQIACKTVWLLTGLGTVAVIFPLTPDLTRGKWIRAAGRIPCVGRQLKRMIFAVRTYRLHPWVLLGSALATVVVHSLFAAVVYWICVAIYSPHPTLGTHFVVAPVSLATGVVPISLGPFEAVLDLLYASIPLPGGSPMTPGQGLVVALGYRVITVLVAAVGLCYYLGSRREVAEVMHEAQTGEVV